jgi:hypothetical protein
MKRDHEERSAANLRKPSVTPEQNVDLFAIGPDIVCLGDMTGIDESEWRFQIQHFVIGDLGKLITFISSFKQCQTLDRYVLANSIGDGRVLDLSPSLTKNENGYLVSCPVQQRAHRIEAHELPKDLALSDKNDLKVERRSIATVSGLEALPQKIRTCLSHQKGESPFHRDFGTRLAEYYWLLRGSPWFEHLFKLEVIRQAAIPYTDTVLNKNYTPLLCVERVWSVKVLAEAPENKRLPIRVDLDVKGIGRWQHELSIFMPQKN